MTTRRVLITGSRDWDNFDLINTELAHAWWGLAGPDDDVVLVSGHCKTGADPLAELSWTANGLIPVRRFTA